MTPAATSQSSETEQSGSAGMWSKGSVTSRRLDDRSEVVFDLPGGYVDPSGVSHREVELGPVTGEVENLLACVPATTPLSRIVTELLVATVRRIGGLERISAALIRELLVGDRDFLMIKLRQTTLGNYIDVILHCLNPDCGKPMDATLQLDQIQIEAKPVTRRFFKMRLSAETCSDRTERLVEFHLPTGADQEALASSAGVDEAAALNGLLARCVRRIGKATGIDPAFVAQLPSLTRTEIEEKMEELAPRVDIELEATCPECHVAFVAPLDFSTLFVSELKNNLSSLEQEIHFLAWHYHWSERDILALTRAKRRRYVELLQREVEHLRH